jgi:MGT family glycosyltransferase
MLVRPEKGGGTAWSFISVGLQEAIRAQGLPEAGSEPLIYLSLGSLGSADIGLMRKLIAELADTPYRVIVSMGPQAAELELAPNMAGAEFLPQTKILPEVDLVITHGGNNTVTESLYFGKPMVVLPLFWDQHDNAQRLDETGYGIRLDTYEHSGEQLLTAIERLLGDERLAGPRRTTAARLQSLPGTERAADLIEWAALQP